MGKSKKNQENKKSILNSDISADGNLHLGDNVNSNSVTNNYYNFQSAVIVVVLLIAALSLWLFHDELGLFSPTDLSVKEKTEVPSIQPKPIADPPASDQDGNKKEPKTESVDKAITKKKEKPLAIVTLEINRNKLKPMAFSYIGEQLHSMGIDYVNQKANSNATNRLDCTIRIDKKTLDLVRTVHIVQFHLKANLIELPEHKSIATINKKSDDFKLYDEEEIVSTFEDWLADLGNIFADIKKQ